MNFLYFGLPSLSLLLAVHHPPLHLLPPQGPRPGGLKEGLHAPRPHVHGGEAVLADVQEPVRLGQVGQGPLGVVAHGGLQANLG